jgi:hypothetical protein
MLQELAARGIQQRLLAFAEVEAPLREELGATPFFRYNLYWRTDHDPLCGPAYAFHVGAQMTREDLSRIGDLRPDDILFVPWAGPAVFWGVLQWMRDLPPQRLPLAIFNFLDVPDVTLQSRGDKIDVTLPDYRIEPSAMFLRFAAKHVTPALGPQLRLGCAHPEGVAVLRAVLGLHVQRFPAPQHAVTSRRGRGRAGPLTIGMAGHQRGHAKGVRHMPELVQGVLQSHPGVQFLIHDGSGDLLPEVSEALLHLAADDGRVSLHKGPLDSREWANLLDRIDLMVCPYSRPEYRLSSSGIHNEAIANAIPSVVPSDTTLSAAAKEFCDCSLTFGKGEPASILAVTRDALDNFDRLAEAAQRGAAKWREVNGPAKLIDAFFAMARGAILPLTAEPDTTGATPQARPPSAERPP